MGPAYGQASCRCKGVDLTRCGDTDRLPRAKIMARGHTNRGWGMAELGYRFAIGLCLALAGCQTASGGSAPANRPLAEIGQIVGLRYADKSSFTMTDDGGILAIINDIPVGSNGAASEPEQVDLTSSYVVATDRAQVKLRVYVLGTWDGPAESKPSLKFGPAGALFDASAAIPSEGSFQTCRDFVLPDKTARFQVQRKIERVAGQASQLQFNVLTLEVVAPDAAAPGPDDCDPPPRPL